MAPGHTVPGATSRLRMYVIVKHFGVENFAVGNFGSIFYIHSVVGNITYLINTKMGGRTHSAIPLPTRT